MLSNGEHLDPKRLQLVKLSEWFDRVKPRKVFDVNNSDEGKIPLYNSGNVLNIIKYINDYSYNNQNNEQLLIITFDGNIYPIYDKIFAIRGHNDMHILKVLKENLNIELNSKLLQIQLFNIDFGFKNKITFDKIKDIDVYLYI